MKKNILVINPGSTSTKIAVFAENILIVENTINHNTEALAGFMRIIEQWPLRKDAVVSFLAEAGIPIDSLSCVVARGGLLKPISGGTYLVNEDMCDELKTTTREHASNLAALIAKEIADSAGIQAFIVDPVIVDEMEPLAKISGLNGVERISIFHALNQKACAHKAADHLGKKYEECNFIVAHMGGGITVGAHKQGKVVDVNNALDGEGPFTPERTGSLPLASVIDFCYNRGYSQQEVQKMIVGKGGLISYFNTNDGRAIEQMIRQGDEKAKLVYEAMSYQVAKEVGSCAAVLKGNVEAIILTGGLAYSKILIEWIKERVEFVAPVIVFPGEGEMEALASAGFKIMNGEENYMDYQGLK